ncbi:unnamed protein product [Hyaloperonospora brassicae]|uniref:RxLR effector candidate protein n=1 Tax=Hyaloperonospora brassicae TaxID=162125 RepID=A0AAV0TP10_HYABA|nr:unnamed protein product [Hyaloperonospora brassicae]
MKQVTALLHAVALFALCLNATTSRATATYQKCLGLEMDSMLTTPFCMELFSACQAGVDELNQKLHLTALDAFEAVRIVSANKSETETRKSERVGIVVQLAPLSDCPAAVVAESIDRRCKLTISRAETYSMMMVLDVGVGWNLESYNRHVLSDIEDNKQAPMGSRHNNGRVNGSNGAVEILDARDVPFKVDVKEVVAWTRIFVTAASVAIFLICFGLCLHQRRRLHYGYVRVPTIREMAQEARLAPQSMEIDGLDREWNR